ncbi:MAG: hypothetical protein IT317_20760 [Anaerolineales bacterium]|nr:hypothetical protein [Anaerolineales bacterium]
MPRRYLALLVVITLAGAGLRLWQLAAIPPGLHYDLAATALLGNAVAFDGYRPVFISAYTGHEALFYYWLALWFRLGGSSVFTLRLAAAMLGVLAVPAGFFAIREALRFADADGREKRGLSADRSLPLAALAAATLATSFFHVTFSRFGFRVISEPVVQALALGFLLRGVRLLARPGRGAWWWLALGGLFTGLAAYTYLAARLFPIPLAVLWLALLAQAARANRVEPGALRRALGGFGLFALTALSAFAPLGVYFYQHPADFFNRAGQVAPRAGEGALLLEGLRRAFEMLFISGEPYDRYNLPGLPLFGPLLGAACVLGWLLTLRRALRWPRPGLRAGAGWAAELLLLAWVPVMLLPTALSVHDIFPSNIRAFGLVPLLFAFPARGLLAAYRWVQQRLPGRLLPVAYPQAVIILAVLAAGVYTTGHNYFGVWVNLPNQPLNNDADLTGIADYLNAQTDLDATAVYVSSLHYRHPTLAYLAHDFDHLRWLTGGTSLAVPARGPVLYAFARSAPPPDEWLAGWQAALVASPRDPDGAPRYRIYSFDAGAAVPLPALAPLAANFGNVLTLTGYQFITATARLLVDTRWRVENLPAAGDYLPYARLVDEWGATWAQSGGFSYPSEQWQVGDTLLVRLALPLPAGQPPGTYTVKLGVYSQGAAASLPHLAADGAYAGDRAALPPLALPGALAAGPEALRAEQPVAVAAQAASLPTLLGYQLNTPTPRQGERLLLTLFWQAGASGPVEVRLGATALYAGDAAHGTLRLGALAAGDALVDRYDLRVPADFAPGAADLTVTVGGATATLAALDVQAVERAYTPPSVTTPTDAVFGGQVALTGYTLTPGADGAATTLAFRWQALAALAEDYTVFVHVSDAAGRPVTQQDAQPHGGAYPTSLWQPGEYVLDEYQFNLPPGDYVIELGLYLPETGERLALAGGADALTLPVLSAR